MPQFNCLIIAFVLLLLGGCIIRKTTQVESFETRSVDVLLIAYDNGDGRAFRNLLPELTNRNINWHLIAFGPAADLFEPSSHITILNHKVQPKEAWIWKENRKALLSEKLTHTLVRSWNPRVLIAGMAHRIQAELITLWWQKGAWTIAFYDSFETPTGQDWIHSWLEAQPPVEEIFVPSIRLTESFPQGYTRSKGVSAVAHPVLLEWHESISRSEPKLLRESLGLNNSPIILIAGGYGEGYSESLELMAEAASLRPDIQWLIAPHPRYRGEQEQVLLEEDNPPPFQIINNEPSIRLAAIADLVISYKSTVSWLTSQLGIPSLFVRPEAEPGMLGLIKVVNSSSSLLNAVHKNLDQLPRHSAPARIHDLPRISSLLEQRIKDPVSRPPQLNYLEETSR